MSAKRQAVIARIREHYGSLGIPLDELSDREIEQGVRQLAYAAREAGIGSKEATEAMRSAVAAARTSKPSGQEEEKEEREGGADELDAEQGSGPGEAEPAAEGDAGR